MPGFDSKRHVMVLVLVAFFSFLIGTRWDAIQTRVPFFGSKTQNSQLPESLDYSSVNELYNVLREKYDGQLSAQQMLDGIKHGLAQATGDPYTVFLNEDEIKAFNEDLNGEFTGIGAELGIRDDQLVIIAPLDGFPAAKAGLRSGDAILAINGEDTSSMSIEEAVSKIRGEKGTDVTLTLNRAGDERFDKTITRDNIVIPSVKYEILEDNIGYLQITRFAEDTTDLAGQAVNALKDKGMKSIILDLRNNGGGYLDGAVDIAGLWLDNKVVVEQKQGDKVIDSLKSGSQAPLKGFESIVLINEGSASASEIVAGALQDHQVATIVGQTSFGKGSVQELEDLKYGGELKVTIARWYTPNGRNIDEEGITPEVEIGLSNEDYDAGRDPQKDKAIELLGNGN